MNTLPTVAPIDLQTWAALLTIIAVFVTIAQFWDRHYVKSKTSNLVRDAVIAFYLRLQKPMPWSDIKEFYLDITLYIASVVGFYGGILLIARIISTALYDFLLVLGIGLLVPISLYLVGCIALKATLLVLALHAAADFMLVHILDKMSDPKISPFTYILSLLGLASAIGKAAIDIYKYLLM